MTGPAYYGRPILKAPVWKGEIGWYLFTGLCDGTYRIEYDANQTALTGVLSVIPGVGTDRAIDSNQNPDGFTVPMATPHAEQYNTANATIGPSTSSSASRTTSLL